jgi:hypothetical protein
LSVVPHATRLRGERQSRLCQFVPRVLGSGGGVAIRIYFVSVLHIHGPAMTKRKAAAAKAVSDSKVAMSYRLSRTKIARAQHILGTPTATATIEEALDLVAFRDELSSGIDKAFGMPIDDAFPPSGRRKRR